MVVTNTTVVLEKILIYVFPLTNFFISSIKYYYEKQSPCPYKTYTFDILVLNMKYIQIIYDFTSEKKVNEKLILRNSLFCFVG